MIIKRFLALTLAGLLFVPPTASPATPFAVLTGLVTTTGGAPLKQVELDLVNLDNGKITPTRTDGAGAFRTSLEPGLYTFDAGRSGYRVASGHRVVSLASGQAGTAEISLASLQSTAGQQGNDRDQEAAPLLPPARNNGFFGSKAGIITLSAIGLAGIVTVILLTRDKDKGTPDPGSPTL